MIFSLNRAELVPCIYERVGALARVCDGGYSAELALCVRHGPWAIVTNINKMAKSKLIDSRSTNLIKNQFLCRPRKCSNSAERWPLATTLLFEIE